MCRLSWSSRAEHSSWAASPRFSVSSSSREPLEGSIPQADRLATDWLAHTGVVSTYRVPLTSVTCKARSRSTAASARVMGASALKTVRPAPS